MADIPAPNLSSLVSSNPKIMGGTVVFVGTRVPLSTFFEHLEAGDSLDIFLDNFPSVTRDQTVAILEALRLVVEERASAA